MRRRPEKRRAQRVAELAEILRSRGLALTLQRRAVLEAVIDRTDHPSADRLHADIKATHPDVSRATVFRTLETLVELGVLRRVCHPGAAVRYDPKIERHHHLVCLRCSKMTDFRDPRLDAIALPAAEAQGFHLSDYSIQFRGICDDCRKRLAHLPPKRRGMGKSQGRRRNVRGC